ncbi:hypothetical protein [Chryseobacterium sp. FH1]|uniref:hypothetical protein n=1 Tax=Chryseobacterium sp. FH1 TaxID=1233951 RepID=UPI0009770A7C|nr:hypothetical protein [Chryseobacterium sp. FH1]
MIFYSDEFESQFNEIIDVLYKKEYLGFKESALDYGDRIYDFIFKNINKPISKLSPKAFQKFGEYYIKYKANENTTWYIFFDRKDNRFLVNHILNNHTEHFPELFLE